MVISWIPPYNVPVSFENLEKSFDGYGPADGLSHIAPQFWVPDGNGGISYVTRDDYSMDYMNDDSVKVIRDWGNQYGIKTMLCIYNGEHGWDWSLVSTSISAANRQSFVDAIVTEMKRLNLHGVEVDLEGPNADSPTDTENFLLFMEKLSDTLSSLGKDLTIATFASREWDHIPDASHWPELLPLVDGITSMGYEETGINATGDLSYAGQKSMAAGAPEKLMLGMPDHLDSWQGSSALQQVEWAQDNGVGVALWDMQLRNEAWQRRDIWKALSEIRGPLGTTYT
uniref:Chitinase, GH18 family n=1 Tax=Chitinivibrio alkaliphilus ACht1 TaxID=1313304 RepID=UPI002D21EE8D|nr:Chain A, Chitinase, GH18 family [Chitinivibrio alkaliphilus ACht1]